MRFSWPVDTNFTRRVLTVEQDDCSLCQRHLVICDHRFHRIFTFDGPVEIVCELVHCPDRLCPAHAHTLSPLAETQLTLPRWTIGWDVFCWLGHRRFARHWSIPQLQAELRDSHHIPLSQDALADYLRRYQTFVAARQQDDTLLADAYRGHDNLILTIDGLQPEKGHETLYVVRELRAKRVWFAEALLSSTAEEVRRLIARAQQWAEQLGKPVSLWMSDKQDAFVSGIAAEFPDVPHRYCQNHFPRDVAKPVLEADSHAKVKMRAKVRGPRSIERAVLAEVRLETPVVLPAEAPMPTPLGPTCLEPDTQPSGPPILASHGATAKDARQGQGPLIESPKAPVNEGEAAVVLDYRAAVRGILNDDQGGPLSPPGLRMAAALVEVGDSLQRNLEAKKGGVQSST